MIKTAAQILAELPQSRGGRPPLNRRCELPECDDTHHGQGLCKEHLRRKDRWGDPLHVYVPAGRARCACPIHKVVR
jgi:hypothetical protein